MLNKTEKFPGKKKKLYSKGIQKNVGNIGTLTTIHVKYFNKYTNLQNKT